MKVLISESAFNHIIKEFEIKANDPHVGARAYQRFIGQNFYNVVVFPDGDYTKQIIIGKYRIPPDLKTKIVNLLDFLLEDHIVGFDDVAYVISLHKFQIGINDIKLNGDKKQQEIYKQYYYDAKSRLTKTRVYLQEIPMTTDVGVDQSLSTGFHLVCFVKNNYFRTMLLARTTDPNKLIEMTKDRTVTDVYYIDQPLQNIQNFIDRNIFKRGRTKTKPSIKDMVFKKENEKTDQTDQTKQTNQTDQATQPEVA